MWTVTLRARTQCKSGQKLLTTRRFDEDALDSGERGLCPGRKEEMCDTSTSLSLFDDEPLGRLHVITMVE